MMEAARRDLARMRESEEAWQELRYQPTPDTSDANEVRRAKVLWALQYDRQAGDLPLLRYLAEQEARYRSEEQGLGEAAELAGFLLAGHRQPEDVWRHHAIKRANFDAGCAYDVEHLFAAGVQATLDHVRASDHPDRDDVLEMLRSHDLDDEDLAEWWEHRCEYFPADPADEDALTLVERATLAGEKELARAELDRWLQDRERDEATLDLLRFHLIELGELAEAAQVAREGLAFVSGDRAMALQRLASLERRSGNHRAAWEALRECPREPVSSGGFVRELFFLARRAEQELAREVFAEADRQARDVPRLPPVVLRAAVEAADRIGDQAAAEYYRELLDR
ncbi:hypothetical protein ACIA8G_01310 [Lentzea sp. NPDC051213]|uniref:hypothetical protein n=1 Tax=Lentzea sp. NPDC051213 TaxID=3364126 RepID=UPI00379AFACF